MANDNIFSDIQNYWGRKAIAQLADRQIIKGYPDGTFRPEATITRAEFAALLLQVFPEAKEVRDPINFPDVSDDHWAKKAIEFASSRGFFSGYPDRSFRPEMLLPRVQAMVVLANGPDYQAAENDEETINAFFDDGNQIPNYAREAIAGLAENLLVVNYPKIRELRPNENATRGEVAALISQSLQIPDVLPLRYIPGANLLVIEPQFDRALSFSEGVASVTIDSKNRVIDKNGQVLFEPEVESIQSFADGLALAKGEDSKYCFWDKTGNIAFEFDYPGEYFYNFSEGLVVFRDVEESKYGYKNLKGEVAIAPQFDDAKKFTEGLAAVKFGEKYGFIDKTGEFVIQPKYDSADSFADGAAWVYLNGQQGFIDKSEKFMEVNLNLIGPPGNFSDGMAIVNLGTSYFSKKFGFINKSGEMVIEAKYDFAYSFAEGLAPVELNGKYVFIDKTGKVAIAQEFQRARSFSEGLALVRVNDKFGYIDGNGEFVIEPQFDCASSFANGMAGVNIGGRLSRFSDVLNASDRNEFCRDGKWGYVRTPL